MVGVGSIHGIDIERDGMVPPASVWSAGAIVFREVPPGDHRDSHRGEAAVGATELNLVAELGGAGGFKAQAEQTRWKGCGNTDVDGYGLSA